MEKVFVIDATPKETAVYGRFLRFLVIKFCVSVLQMTGANVCRYVEEHQRKSSIQEFLTRLVLIRKRGRFC